MVGLFRQKWMFIKLSCQVGLLCLPKVRCWPNWDDFHRLESVCIGGTKRCSVVTLICLPCLDGSHLEKYYWCLGDELLNWLFPRHGSHLVHNLRLRKLLQSRHEFEQELTTATDILRINQQVTPVLHAPGRWCHTWPASVCASKYACIRIAKQCWYSKDWHTAIS